MKRGLNEPIWHWLTPDRQDRSGGKWDLVTLLSNGTLPPETLVWTKGWGEWLPATKVAELENALPAGSAQTAVVPSESKDPKQVPPKPDEPAIAPEAAPAEAAQLKPAATPAKPAAAPAKPAAAATPAAQPTAGFAPVGAAARTTAVKFTRPQISPPRIVLPSERNAKVPEADPVPPSSFGLLGAPKQRPPAVAAPPLIAHRTSPFGVERGTHPYEAARPPMPTLADEAPPPTTTLRPPAAVPPPPRGTSTAGPNWNPAALARFARLGRAEDTPLPIQRPAPTGSPPEGADEIEVEMALDDSAPTLSRNEPPTQQAAPTTATAQFDSTAATMVGHRPPSAESPSPFQPKPAETAPAKAPPAQEAPAPAPGPAVASFTSTLDSAQRRESMREPLASSARTDHVAARGPAPPRDQKLRRLQLLVYVLASVVALLGITAVGLFVARKHMNGAPSEAPSATASATIERAPTRCQVVAHPARLSATIDRTVPPLLASAPSGARAALGFAETSKRAVGLMVVTKTLEAERVFEKPLDRALKSVVPLVSSGATAFALDADGSALKSTRSVDAKLPFAIGLGEGGVARVISSTPELIWPLTSSAITEPRVATLPDSHLVTFRDGGLEGRIMIGWLAEDGSKRSDLVTLAGPQFVGTPFAAAAKQGWVVAFAGRASSQDAWRVELASGQPGKTDARRTTFEAPPGGLGGGQIAPSVAALARGHWLLQWTEGKSGMYQVRTQLLGPALQPLGQAVLVSPKGASSGQGALFVTGTSAISLYVQTIAGHDELWATSLECR